MADQQETEDTSEITESSLKNDKKTQDELSSTEKIDLQKENDTTKKSTTESSSIMKKFYKRKIYQPAKINAKKIAKKVKNASQQAQSRVRRKTLPKRKTYPNSSSVPEPDSEYLWLLILIFPVVGVIIWICWKRGERRSNEELAEFEKRAEVRWENSNLRELFARTLCVRAYSISKLAQTQAGGIS